MSGHMILVVDDQPDYVNILTYRLQQAGFKVITAASGGESLRQLYDNRPDLVILDLVLPDPAMDGLTVCKRIREVSNIPILILTAQPEEDFAIQCLEAGADDYIMKPIKEDILVARVRANLRRASTAPHQDRHGVAYSDGYLTVNTEERRVLKDGSPVKLSPTEFNLLIRLIESSPKVVAYRDLLQSVWGSEYVDDIDYLRVYVWHLRRKLERDPQKPIYISNELGIGYRFERQI
jgi:two-component system KDP operon response regulator KdpE